MRFNRWLFLVLGLLLPTIAFCSGDDALFSKANVEYAKGQYQDAQKTYQQIADDGYQSAALYFNMGNACYKNEDIPSAILYYEKAHKLAPGDDDINFNLRFANSKITDKIEQAPEFFLANWWRAFILFISARGLAILSVILFLAASASLVNYFFAAAARIKKSFFYTSIISFIIGIIAIFMAAMQTSYFDSHRQAIIFSSSTVVKSSPAEKAGGLFVLHEGTKVDVTGDSDGWVKIKLANGNEGWIKEGDIKEI